MNVVIIEDEIPAAKNLQAILGEAGDITIIACLDTIAESVNWFKSNPAPDLVFMDIHLADGSAFEIFERTHVSCPVIFTTAYDEYAIKAFKVNSIDYLLKPIDSEEVLKSVQKFKILTKFESRSGDIQQLIESLNKRTNYRTNFLVPFKSDKLVPVSVKDVACIHIDNGITRLLTFDEKSFVVEDSLDDIMESLDPASFIRVNRQYIISRDAIQDVDLWFNNRLSVNLKVKSSEKIITSRSRTSHFKHWLTNR